MNERHHVRTWLVLLLLMAGAGAVIAQTQAQFRSSTEIVQVYATVQEPGGRLVPDLRQDEFIIKDNGKEQPITFFENARSPFSVVIMLDRSGSMLRHQTVIRDAAAAFVEMMMPRDQARIGSIGTRVVIAPPAFTSDHQELLAALSQPLSGGASPVWFSIDQSVTALYGLEGRRVVLILSDGHDEPADTTPSTPFKGVVERVRRADVMVYAVGFASVETWDGKLKVDHPDRKLQELAEVSGGGYFELSDTADLTRLFTRVAEELHQQYWLGFAPPKRDGKIHEIEVKLKRSGLIVRARQSYVAPQ